LGQVITKPFNPFEQTPISTGTDKRCPVSSNVSAVLGSYLFASDMIEISELPSSYKRAAIHESLTSYGWSSKKIPQPTSFDFLRPKSCTLP
jgi:hypothetical protein